MGPDTFFMACFSCPASFTGMSLDGKRCVGLTI
jgi:hypothetical protein